MRFRPGYKFIDPEIAQWHIETEIKKSLHYLLGDKEKKWIWCPDGVNCKECLMHAVLGAEDRGDMI